MWVTNDLNAWHIAKLRQHAQDPTKSAGRSGFEGALSTASIPLSPNYFDVLSEEEESEGEQTEKDAPWEMEKPREQNPETQEPQWALSRNLRGKA